MSQLVHVWNDTVPHSRHQEEYPDGMTPDAILTALQVRQLAYGKLERVGPNGEFERDILDARGEPTGRTEKYDLKLILDYPETIVAVGKAVGKRFVEIKRIHGPAPVTQ